MNDNASNVLYAETSAERKEEEGENVWLRDENEMNR
jgi:hypothetical protein